VNYKLHLSAGEAGGGAVDFSENDKWHAYSAIARVSRMKRTSHRMHLCHVHPGKGAQGAKILNIFQVVFPQYPLQVAMTARMLALEIPRFPEVIAVS
jgi:hypothetical protein